MNVTLEIVYAGGRAPEMRALADGTYAIGRDSGDIVLNDPQASGRHGELVVQGARVTFRDLGSTNGSFFDGARLSQPVHLTQGQAVQVGHSELRVKTIHAAPQYRTMVAPPAAEPLGVPHAAPAPVVPQAAPVVAQAAPVVAQAAPVGEAPPRTSPRDGAYHHPGSPVRHSYPLAIEDASIAGAVGLLAKTLPYALARFGILVAVSVATIVWFAIAFGGFAFFGGKVHPFVGYGWLFATAGVYGWVWWFVVRYFLYLMKAGHIAVLTELITTGSIGNGDKGMFAYGKDVVKERFGQVNALFALDVLIHGVVKAFNRSLDFVAGLIPIPGLQQIVGIVNAVLYAATTYIDETIFSYGLARRDDNPWRSAQDGLVYYAQNSKEVLKTSIWIVVLDKVLTIVAWVVMLAPAFALAFILPSSIVAGGTLAALAMAALFASNIRGAFLKPLFLIMVMTKFHKCAQNQAINPEWDGKLTRASGKFSEIKNKAMGWSGSPSAPAGNESPNPNPA